MFKNNSVYCTQVRHGIVQSLHTVYTRLLVDSSISRSVIFGVR